MNIKRLLVIDNDSNFNQLVKFVLEHDTDWEIVIALKAREGIIKAKAYYPDVILLDTAVCSSLWDNR